MKEVDSAISDFKKYLAWQPQPPDYNEVEQEMDTLLAEARYNRGNAYKQQSSRGTGRGGRGVRSNQRWKNSGNDSDGGYEKKEEWTKPCGNTFQEEWTSFRGPGNRNHKEYNTNYNSSSSYSEQNRRYGGYREEV
jgi:hypothetical protein